jgi:hypothetical protein
MKKFFTIGMAAILGASLSFFACESAADGAAGSAGAAGAIFIDSTVTAADLAAAFALSDNVILQSGVSAVDGVVPADKTLVVVGSGTKVKAGKSLDVQGTLEIAEGAALDASYVTGVAGYLKGAGTVTGEGSVSLPYFGTGAAKPEDVVDYTASLTGLAKAVGSYNTSTGTAAPGGALDNAGIVTLFALPEFPSELTVSKITDLTANAVPAGKTLTLKGTENTIKSDVATFNPAGTLTVAEGAVLTLGAGTAVAAGKITNNGTISSATTTAATATGLLALTGSGTIAFTESVDLGGTATLALTQNVTVGGSSKTLTAPAFAGAAFSGTGKTITVESGNTLALPAAVKSVGVTVVNEGAVTTASTAVTAVNTIAGIGGAVEATSLTSGSLTVPEGTNLTLSGAFTGAATDVIVVNGKLTAGSSATFATISTGSLTVDAKGVFVANNNTTLVALENLTVNGTFTGGSGTTLAAVKALTLNGTLNAEAATFGTGKLATSATGTGTLFAGVVDIDALVKLAAVATLTSQVETAAISKAITVNGTVALTKDVSLTAALTIGTNGRVALAGKKITLGNATAAKIAGGTAYEITPESNNTNGTLTAGGDGTAVVFTAAGIEGYGYDGESFADAATDPASAATLAFGAADSKLAVKGATTVAGVILDVSAKGSITVAANQKLTLGLGAGAGHIASGGIFTKASTAKSAVKANAATQASSPDIDLAKAGSAKVKKSATGEANNLVTGSASTEPAAGVITGTAGTGTTIDKDDTFTVTGTTIAVTHG